MAADLGEEDDRATSGTKSLAYTGTTAPQSTIQGASPAVGASGSMAAVSLGKPPHTGSKPKERRLTLTSTQKSPYHASGNVTFAYSAKVA